MVVNYFINKTIDFYKMRAIINNVSKRTKEKRLL